MDSFLRHVPKATGTIPLQSGTPEPVTGKASSAGSFTMKDRSQWRTTDSGSQHGAGMGASGYEARSRAKRSAAFPPVVLLNWQLSNWTEESRDWS